MRAEIQDNHGRLPGSETRAIALLALFVSVQIADALLTSLGIARFGAGVEANPILRFWVTLFGSAAVLSVAKSSAVASATMLDRWSQYFVLALLTVLYVFVAIVPWTWTLAL